MTALVIEDKVLFAPRVSCRLTETGSKVLIPPPTPLVLSVLSAGKLNAFQDSVVKGCPCSISAFFLHQSCDSWWKLYAGLCFITFKSAQSTLRDSERLWELSWLQAELVCLRSEVWKDADTLRFTLGCHWKKNTLLGTCWCLQAQKSSKEEGGEGEVGDWGVVAGQRKERRIRRDKRCRGWEEKFSLLSSNLILNVTRYFCCLLFQLFFSYFTTGESE